MKPKLCTQQQCRSGVPSARCMVVAALVFGLLAFASGAFAQVEETSSGEEGAEEAGEEPATTGVAEPASATPEEVAGDVEPLEEPGEFSAPIDSADSGEDEWGEFDEWEEEESASGGGSGGKAWDFQLGGFVEGLVAPRVVRSAASANEYASTGFGSHERGHVRRVSQSFRRANTEHRRLD